MSCFIHGDNIATKLRSHPRSVTLKKLKAKYDAWKTASLAISNITRADTDSLVDLLENYKSFICQPLYRNKFTSQSKLHSSVIEEFMYYLFRRIPNLEPSMELGTMKAYTNLFFAPANLAGLHANCGMSVYTKNQDFAIAKAASVTATPVGSTTSSAKESIRIPVVSAECKTYVDKTMYEGSVATAERIKQGNPYSRFIIVAEFYDVAPDVDPKHSKIDQIYILRKQSSNKGKTSLNPIDKTVVWQLFTDVQKHLDAEWSNMKAKLATGLMI